MELRKGYKQTEVGVIPEDWGICELSDAVEFLDGQRRPVKSSDRAKVSGTYPYYGASGIIDYVSEYLFNDDLILLGEDGENILSRNLPLAFKVSGKIWVNNHAHVLKPKETFDITYLTDFLESLDYRLLNSGTAQPKLNKQACLKIKIAKPSLTEQTAIATALSDADALISSLEKLIEKKRSIKQGAMQELLKPKEGWVVKKLGEIGECIIGLTYSPDNVKESGMLVLRSSNIQGNSLQYDNNVYVDSDVPDKLIVKENDILICVRNGSRDLIGKCALIRGKAIGETFGAFMSIFRSPYNEFVFNLFQSNIIKRQIDEYLGATINQITNKSLNSFEVPFPSPEEQGIIVEILSGMDSEIVALEQSLSKYKMLKQGMMQELLTGKTRLI